VQVLALTHLVRGAPAGCFRHGYLRFVVL
jgi:hypothetical protein